MHLEEKKQQISFAYIHAIATHAGYTVDRPSTDYDSVDLLISAKGLIRPESQIRSPSIALQVKATSCKQIKEKDFSYDLPIKNYNDLRLESCIPRYLVILVLPLDPEFWMELNEERLISRGCAYYRTLIGLPPVQNESTRVVKLLREDRFTPESLEEVLFKHSLRRWA